MKGCHKKQWYRTVVDSTGEGCFSFLFFILPCCYVARFNTRKNEKEKLRHIRDVELPLGSTLLLRRLPKDIRGDKWAIKVQICCSEKNVPHLMMELQDESDIVVKDSYDCELDGVKDSYEAGEVSLINEFDEIWRPLLR